jgi:hypothetical protein
MGFLGFGAGAGGSGATGVEGGSKVAGVPPGGIASGLGPAGSGVTLPAEGRRTRSRTRAATPFVRDQSDGLTGFLTGLAGAATAGAGPSASSAGGRAFGRAQLQPPTPASMFPSIQF